MPLGDSYNACRQLRRVPAGRTQMRDSDFKMRKVAAALFGVLGMDATPDQLNKARKAVSYFNEGKPVALILLLLRIKPTKKPEELAAQLSDKGERVQL